MFWGRGGCRRRVGVQVWRAELEWVGTLVGGWFARAEPRRQALRYLEGLLAPLERNNGWTFAEHAEAVSPDGMQQLVCTAGWDVDVVGDDLRGYVVAEFGV